MVLPNSQCAMGSIIAQLGTRALALILVISYGLVLVACSSKEIEIRTRTTVNIYSQPDFQNRSSNQVVGVIPADTVVQVRKQVVEKDHAAYEIEYASDLGHPVRGYVILSDDVEVRSANPASRRN